MVPRTTPDRAEHVNNLDGLGMQQIIFLFVHLCVLCVWHASLNTPFKGGGEIKKALHIEKYFIRRKDYCPLS